MSESKQRPETSEQLWRVRERVPLDDDMMVSQWLMSYCLSREGWACGAQQRPRGSDSRDAFWDMHRPIVMRLLQESTVRLVCDVDDPNIVYAWACYSDTAAGSVVHYAVVKYSIVNTMGEDEARAMFRALLGERLDDRCGYSYFARDLAKLGLIPREMTKAWYPSVSSIVNAARAA